jgi:hypothetical protein
MLRKARVAEVNESRGIRVARDPHPVPSRVQQAVDRVAKKASRETEEIKTKRPAT